MKFALRSDQMFVSALPQGCKRKKKNTHATASSPGRKNARAESLTGIRSIHLQSNFTYVMVKYETHYRELVLHGNHVAISHMKWLHVNNGAVLALVLIVSTHKTPATQS